MLESVEKMKRLGQFTKENMIAKGFIDADVAQHSHPTHPHISVDTS